MQQLNDSIQIIVNLRSASVEYTGEVGENRYGCTLRADAITADKILTTAREEGAPEDMTDGQILSKLYSSLKELVGQLGSLTSFTITKGGNEVIIRADDISFITLATTGVFRELQDDSESVL